MQIKCHFKYCHITQINENYQAYNVIHRTKDEQILPSNF